MNIKEDTNRAFLRYVKDFSLEVYFEAQTMLQYDKYG